MFSNEYSSFFVILLCKKKIKNICLLRCELKVYGPNCFPDNTSVSYRWSAYVVDGKVKVLNVEKAPSEFKVSGGEVILGQI